MSNLDESLRVFEALEATLTELEKLWILLGKNIPTSITFKPNSTYENARRSYENLLLELSYIAGWKPKSLPLELDQIAQMRLDALDIGEISSEIQVEQLVEQPGKELREYRFKFNEKRKKVVEKSIAYKLSEIDKLLEDIGNTYIVGTEEFEPRKKIEHPSWLILKERFKQIDILLGTAIRPLRWHDMSRHLSYAQMCDFSDIVLGDWPSVKNGLNQILYSSPPVHDLDNLLESKPSDHVLTKLKWNDISEEDFERLIFNLIVSDEKHENPQWLMHTNAPDRGRDISAYRVYQDLGGVTRRRVMIQCKRIKKGFSPKDFSELKEQVKAWEPPRIDILVIATTGRFTADAITLIEKHNQGDSAMTIEMWAESHLEVILAKNPALVAEFKLR